MSDPASLPTVMPTPRLIDADTVFAALGEPSRRRLLVALFDGQFHPARSLGGSIGKRFDNARKHLEVLVKAGLVVADMDPRDGRRQVYKLAPSVKTETTPQGRTMDFGYCLLRC